MQDSDSQATLSIADVAKKTGMPASTLRYYDKEGLLPDMQRTEGGSRVFTPKDLQTIDLISCLKKAGLSIKEIRRYIQLAQEGNETIPERRELIYERRHALETELAELQRTLDFINYKCWYYDKATELGDESAIADIPDNEIPQSVREFRAQKGI